MKRFRLKKQVFRPNTMISHLQVSEIMCVIMLIATCMMITGCSVTTQQETSDNALKQPFQEENSKEFDEDDMIETMEEIPALDDIPVDITSEEEKIIEPVEIMVDTLENQYMDDDKLLSHVKIDYPIIKNASEKEGLLKINSFLKESAQALFEENDTYANDHVEEIKEAAFLNNEIEEAYCEYLVTVEIKYNANGLLSILQNFSECDYDTKISNMYATGYVFDINTGERLHINDILSGSEDEIEKLIGQTFLNSDKITKNVKIQYKDELLTNTQYTEFYIDNQNINLFYNPNMVAPYAAGTLEAYIPLNTENIFEMKIKQIE